MPRAHVLHVYEKKNQMILISVDLTILIAGHLIKIFTAGHVTGEKRATESGLFKVTNPEVITEH